MNHCVHGVLQNGTLFARRGRLTIFLSSEPFLYPAPSSRDRESYLTSVIPSRFDVQRNTSRAFISIWRMLKTVEDNGQLGFTMVFQSKATPYKKWVEPERIQKFVNFFGPGVDAEVLRFPREDDGRQIIVTGFDLGQR